MNSRFNKQNKHSQENVKKFTPRHIIINLLNKGQRKDLESNQKETTLYLYLQGKDFRKQ